MAQASVGFHCTRSLDGANLYPQLRKFSPHGTPNTLFSSGWAIIYLLFITAEIIYYLLQQKNVY